MKGTDTIPGVIGLGEVKRVARRGPGGLLLDRRHDGRLGQLQMGHQPTTRGEGRG